jgi:zinc protease
MKNQFLVMLSALVLVLPTAFGQGKSAIPVNPKVKIGQLDNGLTYYIRNNPKPEDKVELRLVINAGSILETDAQKGLAHFTEHMCFNGTKNFKKNELVDYLQSIGVKFGAHLNAYTSFDETVYILPIPSDTDSTLESGLQILEDWAHNVLFTDEEIDKERGVVLEEYRLGLGADKRMMQEYLPKVMYQSRYAERLPIGKKDVLENFEYETIRSFYRDWYRPDLMAVVAVGDVDVDKMEALIKTYFSRLKNPKKPKKREEYGMPAHEETLVSIETDPEATFSRVSLYYKNPEKAEPVTKENQYTEYLVRQLFTTMINNRLDELRNQPNPPFVYGGMYYGGTWARGYEAYQGYAMTPQDGQMKALRVLLEENERVRQHGFTAGELERAQLDVMAGMKRAYQERDKQESNRLVNELVRNFLEQEPIPGIEWEYQFYQKYLNTITLDQVNSKVDEWIRDNNRVVVLTGPPTDNQPSEEEVVNLLNEVIEDAEQLEPYADDLAGKDLLDAEPTPGKRTKVEELEEVDAQEWTFSNGARVLVKKTYFKNNEILFKAISKGGSSLFSDDEFLKTTFAMGVLNSNGVGGFTKTELDKLLAGKIASVNPYIGELSEGMNGSCSPEDLETMMQLVYLSFTKPTIDEETYQSYVSRQKGMYKNIESNPNYFYSIQMSQFLGNGHVRKTGLPTEEDWDKTDYHLLMKKYQERFSDADDFLFVFVGNFDEDALLAMTEKYIGSLPSNKKTSENFKDPGYSYPEPQRKDFLKGTDPKSMVRVIFAGETDYSKEEDYYLKCLGEIMSIKLVESLREEKGGVYGVGAYGNMSEYPKGEYIFLISFPCGPDRVDDLIDAAMAELDSIKRYGPTEKDLEKIKAAQRRDLKENMKKNRFWLNGLTNAYFYGRDYADLLKQAEAIEKVKAEDIQKVATAYCNGKPIIGVLLPEKED